MNPISPEGLTSADAAARLAQTGPNDPAPPHARPRLLELASYFANPLVLILLLASVVSAFLGELVNAAIVVTMVVLSVAVNFAQTYRSQRATERLRDRVAPTATVLRDGTWRELPRTGVVPGDVVRVSAGDLVPADAELLDARDLHVQQAALTGESMPEEKDRGGAVYFGTSVVSGVGTARVTATGAATAFGDIAARLAARPPETEFERGLRRFGFLILQAVVFLVLFIVAAFVAAHRDAFQSLLFAVALAVGLTPEFLPMITTVTLSRGAVRMAEANVIVKHLSAIQNLGSIDVLCSDKTGTLTAGAMTLEGSVDARGAANDRPRALAAVNSAFETGIKSPLDAAILEASAGAAEGWTKMDEVPFDFERRRLSIVAARGDEVLLVTKGASEGVLAACTQWLAGGEERPLDPAVRDAARATCTAAGARGDRVIAVAYKRVARGSAYTAADETDLVLAGFLTFSDPPLPDARATIAALRKDGVHVKILTGDDEVVARHVCDAVGIDTKRVVLGKDVEKMTDAALAHVVEKANVFARVSPAQKHRILLALKSRSHVVGYLGDGINDAPSLHAADVGIAAPHAVDVARDAADVVLLERGLGVLHRGILEGRRAFGNVTKYLLMGTSSNFGNMFSMAGASILLPFLPMLPTQILLNNLLYDLAQVTIPSDAVDPEFVRAPQRWDIGIIRRFMVLIGPISSAYDFLTFFVLLRVFHASEALFHTGWFVESLATQTLVIFVIRTRKSFLKSRPSTPLAVTTVAVVAFGALLPFTPLAKILGFAPLPPAFFAFLAAATLTYLLLVELVKRRLFGHPPRARRRGARPAHVHA